MINNDSSAYKITEDEDYAAFRGSYGQTPDGGFTERLEGNAAPVLEPEPEYAEPSADEIYVYEHEVRRGNVVLHEIKQKKERRKTKNRILFKVSILLILGLVIGVRFASITEINYRNQALQKQLDTVSAEVQRRQVELDRTMSLTELAEIAETRLGMQKPQQYQVKYVEVERIDQTELANVELTRSTTEKTWFRQVWDAVMEFLGIIN
ncbi:MAG: hypothetical protein J5950_01235 [Clostridia bacterium]|nr:hypothetical protein [Clostridia bacterium]